MGEGDRKRNHEVPSQIHPLDPWKIVEEVPRQRLDPAAGQDQALQVGGQLVDVKQGIETEIGAGKMSGKGTGCFRSMS